MVSCAAAPLAAKAATRPVSIHFRVRDVMRVSISAPRLMMRERSAGRKLRGAPAASQAGLANALAQALGLRPLQAGNDLFRHGFDLLPLVLVRHENDAIDTGRKMRLELLHTLLDRTHDGAVHRRLRPGGVVPLGLQPVFHRSLDLGARTDANRQLIGGAE